MVSAVSVTGDTPSDADGQAVAELPVESPEEGSQGPRACTAVAVPCLERASLGQVGGGVASPMQRAGAQEEGLFSASSPNKTKTKSPLPRTLGTPHLLGVVEVHFLESSAVK